MHCAGPRLSGKTTALQQWVEKTTRQTSWLILEDELATVDVFWQQLLQTALAAQGRDGQAGGTTSIHAVEPSKDPSTDPVSAVSAAMAGAVPLTVIVTNFHTIKGTSFEWDLARLLTRTPELSLVAETRSVLEIEKVQLSTGLDVYVVDADDLTFSSAEAAQFHEGTPLAAISDELNEHFQGLPITHRTARLAAQGPLAPAANLAEHIIARVTDMVLVESISARDQLLTPGIARLLTATLALNHFDEALVRALVPGQELTPSIRILLENNLLSSTNTSFGIRYSYRPIIKAALTRKMAAELASCKAQTLEAAAVFELARKQHSPAFDYAMTNKDYRQGTDILIQSGLLLFADSAKVLQRTLPRIPKTQLVKYPLLTVSLGIMYNGDPGTRFKGLEHFALALSATQLLGKSVPPEERVAMGLARAVALRMTGQFKAAAATSRTALKNLNELSLADRDKLRIFETIALGQWGLTLLLVGDFSSAEKALQQSVATGEIVESQQAQYFSMSLLAYRHAVDGDLQTAAMFAQLASELSSNTADMELYQKTPLAVALAMIELGRLQPDAAAEHLKTVISETATSEFWGRLRVIEAHIDLLRGRAGIASGRLTVVLGRRRDLPALNPLDATALLVLHADLLLTGGNASGAGAALAQLPSKNPAAIITQARLSLATGNPAQTAELLSPKIAFTTALQSVEARVLLTVARLHLLPQESLRADLEMISGAITALANHWPLVMLTASDRELLRTSMERMDVPYPGSATLPEEIIPVKLESIALTRRESTIMATLATTGDRAEIARINFVSLNTVKSQLRSLYKKLGVASREEALLVAYQENPLS
ncbi:LuxR C-terminal-related transcriptional regulator [Arthrobacter sp. BF1]|uniref:LuxR C-terminal-related transcriptional regulator n=1 Tax=Arthrobacter sp. BF1 TaxID=2821145 RepID=UPI001C4E6F6D|nr:LuxR C-terminal-related transcriptional regulator [Arthrobacter sp. BF1]